MNGVHLLRALNELGCPIQDETSPESVEWMFAVEDAVPFLEWFCTNMDPNYNCLSSDELERYARLEQSGHVIDGEQLITAYSNLVGHDQDDVTEVELEKEIAVLKEEYQRREERIGKLIEMTNRLNVQQTNLSHKLSLSSFCEETALEAHKQKLEEVTNDDEALDQELKKLAELCEKLVSMYGSGVGEDGEKSELFLSQQSMDMHSYAHDKLMHSMKNFAQKQFFNGISQIPSADTNENYQLIDLSKTADNETKDKLKLENAAELARLWKVYIQCEQDRVESVVKEEMLSAELSFAQDKLRSYQIPGHCSDMQTLNKELKDTQRQVARNTSEINSLLENRIKDLICHCANSQSVQILQGEYDLKIARQDYFISSQEKVIGHLIRQQALYEFLALCAAREISDHQWNKQLLTAIKMDLKQCLEQYKKRVEVMSRLELRNEEQKTVVDPNDKMIQAMHQIIDPLGHQNSLYVTYKALAESAAKLADDVTAAQNCETSLRRESSEKLAKLEKDLKCYESRIYSESCTKKGVPQFRPQQLVDVMTSLESNVEKLESALLHIAKQVKIKRATLEKNDLLQEERKLFIKFHSDPVKLKSVLEELASRVEARSIGK